VPSLEHVRGLAFRERCSRTPSLCRRKRKHVGKLGSADRYFVRYISRLGHNREAPERPCSPEQPISPTSIFVGRHRTASYFSHPLDVRRSGASPFELVTGRTTPRHACVPTPFMRPFDLLAPTGSGCSSATHRAAFQLKYRQRPGVIVVPTGRNQLGNSYRPR